MKYYILIGNKTGGPYTIEQVKALYDAGTIEQTNLYATTESQDWLPVSMLIPLFNIPSIPPIPNSSQPTIVINNSNNNNSGNIGTTTVNGISQKSRIVYQLLAFFLGSFGVHNFYAGHNTKGLIQLLITVLTCGYGAFISWIWAVIEIFIISVDSNNIPMR
jgi:TM2 domain-containing membrane protein YozV